MMSKKVKSKIFFFTLFILSLVIVIFLILKSLEKNVVYFFSPSEIYNEEYLSLNKVIRVGGLVKEGSIKKDDTTINFIVTDLKNELFVSYNGVAPNLFAEGKGVVAEGILKDKKFFVANKILAKHDENYMPPEISDALNKNNY